MEPWSQLDARVAAALVAGSTKASVLAGPTPTVVPDAIVIRPDDPWISRGATGRPIAFGKRLERYVAVCAVRVADPASSMARLYAMARAVTEAASDDGWDWEAVGSIVLDETTDSPLLTVAVRVTFSG